jgi:hypothetical protein
VSPFKLPRDQVAALRAEDLQLYLDSRGWQPGADASTGLATVCRLPAEPDAEVLVPRRRDISDYVLRMADAAQMLAAVEQRSIWEVLADLANRRPTIFVLATPTATAAASALRASSSATHVRGDSSFCTRATSRCCTQNRRLPDGRGIE